MHENLLPKVEYYASILSYIPRDRRSVHHIGITCMQCENCDNNLQKHSELFYRLYPVPLRILIIHLVHQSPSDQNDLFLVKCSFCEYS